MSDTNTTANGLPIRVTSSSETDNTSRPSDSQDSSYSNSTNTIQRVQDALKR